MSNKICITFHEAEKDYKTAFEELIRLIPDATPTTVLFCVKNVKNCTEELHVIVRSTPNIKFYWENNGWCISE